MNLSFIKQKLTFIKRFFEKHERRIGLAFLIGGFIFDSLTLQRVDFLLDNLVLLSYLTVVALSIIIINVRAGRFAGNRFFSYVSNAAPYLMQFAFGGLFSGYIVFYSRSASLITSWPFLLMLAAFFIGNEFFRERYRLFNFHLAIFFVAVFSYSIFSLPVVFHRLGAGIFILSGLVSLAAVGGLVYLIKKIAPERITAHKKLIIGTIGAIYLAFNVLYFTNIIPPIPLALKEGGIYHRVERMPDGNYLVLDEQRAWYQFLRRNRIHLQPGESAYAYSAVFAPTKLESKIFHRWSFFDERRRRWIAVSRIGFQIVGGRDGGYRGYSVKENVFPGLWRVDVITERGQVIGRIQFRVATATEQPELEFEVR